MGTKGKARLSLLMIGRASINERDQNWQRVKIKVSTYNMALMCKNLTNIIYHNIYCEDVGDARSSEPNHKSRVMVRARPSKK